MPAESTIFGLRFGANTQIEPDQQELAEFLSGKKHGSRTANNDHLAPYQEHLEAIAEFEKNGFPGGRNTSIRDRMYFGVLSHSSFYNPALQSAATLFQYYLQAFLSLDFQKRRSLITAAEREIAELQTGKHADVEQITRLRGLMEDRKSSLKALDRTKTDLVRELRNIASYISDNLLKISRLCEKSIVLLAQVQTEGTEERRSIQDLKNLLEQKLRERLNGRAVTGQDLEAMQQDFAILSTEISKLVREDVFALMSLYESIYDHSKAVAFQLDALIQSAENARLTGIEEEQELFQSVEKVLLSLVSGLHMACKPVSPPKSKTDHGELLEQKRDELLASFFEHARKERRARQDRRTVRNRRTVNDGDYKESERRSGQERRTGKGRRRSQ